ncbi:MAG: hybrid sensor histidine kinase/response regulator [Ignavibacteriales bacterium]|nr:hybrid sensor histidine kinase/response regulator [Ignavibacteriales bacterium]
MFEIDEKAKTTPTVLFVDDTPDNLELLEFALKKKPLIMLRATSGKECLQMAEKEMPDVIVLDIQMPDMDGFETLRRLRANHITQKIPVIFLTASKRDPQSISEGILLGADEYLTKPIDVDELLARVRSIYRVALMEQELERIKAQFTAMLVHDLRSPLTVIRGSVDDLVSHHSKNASLDRDSITVLNTILNSTKGILELVNDLLDLSKYQAGQIQLDKKPLTIHEVIEGSLNMIGLQFKRKNIELHLEFAPDLPKFKADQGKLEQVMNNLLSNAHKFTPGEGKVTIDVKMDHNAPSPTMMISVTDTGIGIPQEELPILFDHFRQASTAKRTTEKGTGLGLAICKLIVQAHGGTIGVESEVNKGTKIFFTLPASG